MPQILKDRTLNYATAKRSKIRKMYVFENLVLSEKNRIDKLYQENGSLKID